jgi:hypothetical protein
MGRSRQNREWHQAMLIGKLVILGILVIWFSPLRAPLLILLVVGVVSFFSFLAIRTRKAFKTTTNYNFTATSPISSPSKSGEFSAPWNLIEPIRSIDWFQFEKLIEILYRESGYSVHRRGGAKPDGGIDLIVEKDGVRKAVQCKHWKTWSVGVKPVREFLGALTDSRIQNGIFITVQGYTRDAKEFADKHRIEIIDEADLRAMLQAIGEKSNAEIQNLLQDQRKFCPKCGQQMQLRTAKKGPHTGDDFWGCSSFPRCRYVMNL